MSSPNLPATHLTTLSQRRQYLMAAGMYPAPAGRAVPLRKLNPKDQAAFIAAQLEGYIVATAEGWEVRLHKDTSTGLEHVLDLKAANHALRMHKYYAKVRAKHGLV